MRVLGISAYAHDAGVAVVENGRPVVAVEEERFNRVRKTTDFPTQSLRYLRERHGLDLSDFDGVAFPWSRRRILTTAARLTFRRFPPAFQLLREAASPQMNFSAAVRFFRVPRDLAAAFGFQGRASVHYLSHHVAHASNAFFLSPFDRAVVLVMDGFGDDCSTSTYRACGRSIDLIRKNDILDSLGILYTMVTKHLGYRSMFDEGKVMALAAYGSDAILSEFRETVRLLPEGQYEIAKRFFRYQRYGELHPVSDLFVRSFGPPRRPGDPVTEGHKNLAYALQRTLEDAVVHIAKQLRESSGERNLCLGGGVALNCLSNARVAREAGFDRVFVSPSPSDTGQALGAALAHAWLGGSLGSGPVCARRSAR